MIRRFLFTSALAFVFLAIAPRLAHAQALISIFQEQSLPRQDKDGKTVQKRGLQFTPEGVSYQDCVDDLRIVFPLQMSNFVGNASLQVFASLSGADCSDQQYRNGPQRVCWPLNGGANIPLTTIQNVALPVREIMSGALDRNNLDATANICGRVDLTTVSVQFLYFNPGDLAKAATTKAIAVSVDTIGPAAPTGLRAKPGSGRLTVEWANISGEAGISVLTGVKVYCDPSGSTDFPNDAGACGRLIEERRVASSTDGGAGCRTVFLTDADGGDAGTALDCDGGAATSSSGGSCTSSNFEGPNGRPIIPSAAFNGCFSCGEIIGNAGSSVGADGVRGAALINGTTYALAVASTDAFNNVGPLSPLVCEYPEETNDFWQNYRNSGGQAGGGCATSGETPIGSIAALTGIGALAFSVVRRRRRTK